MQRADSCCLLTRFRPPLLLPLPLLLRAFLRRLAIALFVLLPVLLPPVLVLSVLLLRPQPIRRLLLLCLLLPLFLPLLVASSAIGAQWPT